MVDTRIAAGSARRLMPVYATSTWSDDEAEQRHLVAIHSPDAPKDHPFHPNTVPARYAPINLASQRNVTRSAGATQAEIVPSGPSVGLTVPGLDYSAKPGPSVAAMKAWGSSSSFRYNTYGFWSGGGAWKEWDPSEQQGLHAAGFGLQPNSEIAGTEPFGGAAAGRQYGDIFVRSLESRGVPKGTKVGDIYSMDTEITSEGQMQQVLAFYEAYNQKMVNAGYSMGTGYIQYWGALRLAKELGLTCWQPFAWSYGAVWDAAACRKEGVDPGLAAFAYQYHNSISVGGADADANWTDPYRMPAWWPPGSPYLSGDDSMSAADVAALKTYLDGKFAALPKATADTTWGWDITWPGAPGKPAGTQPAWAIVRAAGLGPAGLATNQQSILDALHTINGQVTPLSGKGDAILAALAAIPATELTPDQITALCEGISTTLNANLTAEDIGKAVSMQSVTTLADLITKGAAGSAPQLS